jgi:Spy/CpxP family protein refolding chaperone
MNTLRFASHCHLALAISSFVFVACAERRSPGSLPGDSVPSNGTIVLSPPRPDTTPAALRIPLSEAKSAKEPLGPIERLLFPPELIMEHQGELAVEPAKRDAILKDVEKSQAEILRLQWQLQGEKEKLVKALEGDKVDEAKSQAAAAKVMESETKVKAAHLAMLVRVKNQLTPAQQKKLQALREGP